MTRLRSTGHFLAGAALSAALLITGTQAWQVGAAPGDTDATYQPLSPCRLLDTRADFNVGPRTAPIGPGEAYPVQVTGTNGDCVDIPAGATGVAMNVTVLNATAPSNLRVFPADLVDVPLVSNLNYSQTSPPTPNKVDSKLSPDGKIKVFNAFGNVDVIVDVVGVYTNASLVEIENRLLALEQRDLELTTDIRNAIPATTRSEGNDATVGSTWTSVVSVAANISRDGTVLVFASGTAVETEAGADVRCVITNQTAGFVVNDNMRWEAAGTNDETLGEGDAGNLAGTESFSVTAGTTERFYLYCQNLATDGTSEIWDPQITVLFIPNR